MLPFLLPSANYKVTQSLLSKMVVSPILVHISILKCAPLESICAWKNANHPTWQRLNYITSLLMYDSTSIFATLFIVLWIAWPLVLHLVLASSVLVVLSDCHVSRHVRHGNKTFLAPQHWTIRGHCVEWILCSFMSPCCSWIFFILFLWHESFVHQPPSVVPDHQSCQKNANFHCKHQRWWK